MLKEVPRISLKELKGSRPNKLVIDTLKKNHPIVVTGIKEIIDLRKSLKDMCLKIAKIELPEYGAAMGIIKTEHCTHTQQNPIMDQVPAPPHINPEDFQESYRRCIWPDVPGYKDAKKEIFKHYKECAAEIAGHIDAYMQDEVQIGPNYVNLENATRKTPLATCRSFVYRERTNDDIAGEISFNWHYDRTLFGGLIKDIYLLNGKVVDDERFSSFVYQEKEGNFILPIMKDDDVIIHHGMSMHILTAGHFHAHCHGVVIPKVVGLKRISNAYFIQPPPELKLNPPVPYQMPQVQPQDVGLISERLGYKANWKQDMTYSQWNEALFHQYQRVFQIQKKKDKQRVVFSYEK